MDKANQSIKSVNASLSSMEASATKRAKGATQGIDGMTKIGAPPTLPDFFLTPSFEITYLRILRGEP